MNHVDTTGWKLKSAAVKSTLMPSIALVVKEAAQDIYNRANENLSGPGINPKVKGADNSAIGEMPVPRRTGNLARSLKQQPLTPGLSAVFTDEREANYGKYVHDGTRYMKPRRYLGDVVSARGQYWFTRFDEVIRGNIRKVGT